MMKKYDLKLILVLLWISAIPTAATFAFTDTYAEIDKHAKAAPDELRKSIKKLVDYLVEPASNDVEKVRSFYTWICTNIKYDNTAVKLKNKGKKSPDQTDIQKTLFRKLAVCFGYSTLFKAMCDSADIKCHLIKGWGKIKSKTKTIITSPCNHSWNIVFVNNNWYSIDATWGAGYSKPIVDKKGRVTGKRFVAKLRNEFFLPNSKQFIYRHLPNEPMWQLLDCPITLATFKKDTSYIKEKIEAKGICYNYKDSISVYEQLESADQRLNTAERAFTFDDNDIHRVNLVNARCHKGYVTYLLEKETTSHEEKLALAKHALFWYEKGEAVNKNPKKEEWLNNNIESAEKRIKFHEYKLNVWGKQ